MIDGKTVKEEEHREISRSCRANRLFSTIGATFLIIVPVVITVLVPGKIVTLLTACVAVIAFAGCAALVSGFEYKDKLSALAAYAAVVFIFVGTNTAPTP